MTREISTLQHLTMLHWRMFTFVTFGLEDYEDIMQITYSIMKQWHKWSRTMFHVSCLYLHDTVHFGTGKDRKATPRPDGVLRFYIHLILASPWSQPSAALHQQQQYIISRGDPKRKIILQIFHNFCRRVGVWTHFFWCASKMLWSNSRSFIQKQ